MSDPPPGFDLARDDPAEDDPGPVRRREAHTEASAAHEDLHGELPLDPDPARTGPAATAPGAPPVHLQPRLMLLVLAGGVLGTPARYALSVALPTRAGAWPAGTFTANLLGAFLLGALLEALARRGQDSGGRLLLRLALGTGFLGAFTTYSTLAVEIDLLVRAHRPALAVAYAGATVLGGLVATTGGISLATAHHRRRHSRTAAAGSVATTGTSGREGQA